MLNTQILESEFKKINNTHINKKDFDIFLEKNIRYYNIYIGHLIVKGTANEFIKKEAKILEKIINTLEFSITTDNIYNTNHGEIIFIGDKNNL